MSLYNRVYRSFLYSSKDFDEYLGEMLRDRKSMEGKRQKIPDYRREEVEGLLVKGFPYKEIKRRTGVSIPSIKNIKHKLKTS